MLMKDEKNYAYGIILVYLQYSLHSTKFNWQIIVYVITLNLIR